MQMSGQLRSTAFYLLGTRYRYPLDRRMGGPQSRSKRDGEEVPCRPARSLVTILTEVSQLHIRL
jgi:hypothetical protein